MESRGADQGRNHHRLTRCTARVFAGFSNRRARSVQAGRPAMRSLTGVCAAGGEEGCALLGLPKVKAGAASKPLH